MRVSERRQITAAFRTASKSFNIDVHSKLQELTGCKLGIMIDIIKLYIPVLVEVTLIFIKLVGM